MKYLEQFPVTAVFLSFFLFSCLFAYCSLLIKAILLLAVLVFLLLTAFRLFPLRHTLRILLLHVLSASLAAGFLSVCAFDLCLPYCDRQQNKTDTVSLRITECEYTLSYTSRYQAVIRESEFLSAGTRILLDTPMSTLENGTLLCGDITYQSLSQASRGSFDSERYYRAKRIMLIAEDLSLQQTGTRRYFSLTELFQSINEKLSAMILAHIGTDKGGIASAVLLGNRNLLSDAVERDFRRIGISHLLVVSGTHFSVIITFTEHAMRRLRISRNFRAFLHLVLIIFLMLLTGFTPSVVRAGIMHLLAQLGMLLMRKANLIHSFALSGALLVLFNPFSAMDCSLQLSFLATYSCILYLLNRSVVTRFFRRIGIRFDKMIGRFLISCAETVLMTAFISLNMLPLMWLYFGEVSLISIPVNVLFSPLISILMGLTALYLILYPLRIFLYPTAFLLGNYCTLLEKIAGWFSEKDWIMLPVNFPFTVFFLFPLTVLLLLLPFAAKRFRIHFLSASCTVCLLFFSLIGVSLFIEQQNVYFSYLPEKKNDSFVLKADGKALICDISDASYNFMYRLTDEVSALHCCEIETLMLTHYHNKHIQLLEKLAQREFLRNIVLSEPLDEREAGIVSALLETAELYGVQASVLSAGESYSFGPVSITVFERTYLSRSTHPITAVEVRMPTSDAVIVSCSFNESVPDIAEALSHAEYPILGGHSPVYKKAFAVRTGNAKALILDEQALDWIAPECLIESPEVPVYKNPDSFRLRITRSGEESIEIQEDETAS